MVHIGRCAKNIAVAHHFYGCPRYYYRNFLKHSRYWNEPVKHHDIMLRGTKFHSGPTGHLATVIQKRTNYSWSSLSGSGKPAVLPAVPLQTKFYNIVTNLGGKSTESFKFFITFPVCCLLLSFPGVAIWRNLFPGDTFTYKGRAESSAFPTSHLVKGVVATVLLLRVR